MVVLAAAVACGTPASEPVAVSAAADPGTLLAAWIARALPPGAVLGVDDAATAALLARSGVIADVAAPVAPAPGAERYRISTAVTATIRALSPGVAAVPVARFGDGASALLVDRVLPGAAADLAVAASQATALRTAADTALLDNRAVTVCGACRQVIAGGGLDLRAASMVAVLASAGPVVVREVVAEPGESSVGGPARSVVIAGAAPGAVRAVAGATVTGYRPTITDVTTTTTTVTWTLTPATALTGA